jgi:hypothetical protein
MHNHTNMKRKSITVTVDRFLDIIITKPIILVLAIAIGAAFIFLG